MPELPDLTVYCEALERLTVGQRLVKVRLISPFLLRTAEPPLRDAEGGTISDLFSRDSSDDRWSSALEEDRHS